MACLEGLEPPTRGLEGRRSIQLSYRQLVPGRSIPRDGGYVTRRGAGVRRDRSPRLLGRPTLRLYRGAQI